MIVEMAPVPSSSPHPHSLPWSYHSIYSPLLTLDLAYDLLWPVGFSADVTQAKKTSLRKRIKAIV